MCVCVFRYFAQAKQRAPKTKFVAKQAMAKTKGDAKASPKKAAAFKTAAKAAAKVKKEQKTPKKRKQPEECSHPADGSQPEQGSQLGKDAWKDVYTQVMKLSKAGTTGFAMPGTRQRLKGPSKQRETSTTTSSCWTPVLPGKRSTKQAWKGSKRLKNL